MKGELRLLEVLDDTLCTGLRAGKDVRHVL